MTKSLSQKGENPKSISSMYMKFMCDMSGFNITNVEKSGLKVNKGCFWTYLLNEELQKHLELVVDKSVKVSKGCEPFKTNDVKMYSDFYLQSVFIEKGCFERMSIAITNMIINKQYRQYRIVDRKGYVNGRPIDSSTPDISQSYLNLLKS